jgi:hypothetical protein
MKSEYDVSTNKQRDKIYLKAVCADRLRRFLPPRHILKVLQYICGWRTVEALHSSLNSALKRGGSQILKKD